MGASCLYPYEYIHSRKYVLKGFVKVAVNLKVLRIPKKIVMIMAKCILSIRLVLGGS